MYFSKDEEFLTSLNQTLEEERIKEITKYELNNLEIDDPALLAINKLAAYICDTPISKVSIVNMDYCKFISREGSELETTVRKNSFCHYAVSQDTFFEVEDILKDERFVDNAFVKDNPKPPMYYAAWPLKSPGGSNFGVLFVVDFVPRKLLPKQIEALRILRDQVLIQFIIKMQNKELSALNIKAEKLSKVKDEFISNISHEIRTPLNAINGYAHLLAKTSLNNEQTEAVEIIKSSSEILITLVNDILDFSKINSEKLKLEKIPFDLKKTIRLVYDLLRKKIQQKKINFEMKFDEKIPNKILGDEIRINQIIMNLAGNALKFTDKGSISINVNISNETEENIRLDFSVRDTGIGITEEKLKTIFERFEQAGTEITRKFGGTGLGLNISKNLVELHGGELKVKSKLGEGSEFYFSILYDKLKQDKSFENEKLEKSKLSVDSNLLKNQRIMICEDNSVNIKLIKHYFKNKVKYLEIAENGQQAIEKLNVTRFDMILMDIHMPVMDGYEATKYIRNTMKLSLPIIGFTVNNSEDEREKCLSIGMNDYVNKNFTTDEILEKLTKILTLNKKCDEIASVHEFNVKEKVIFKNFKSISPTKTKRNKLQLNFLKKNTIKFKSYQNLPMLRNMNKENSDLNIIKIDATKPSKFSGSIGPILKTEKVNKEVIPSKNLLKSKECFEINQQQQLDHVNLKNIQDFSGNDKIFEKELIHHFLEKFPKDLGNLLYNFTSRNYKEVDFYIHKIKSPLVMFGLKNIISQLEEVKLLCNQDYIYKLALDKLTNVENNLKIINKELHDLLESNYGLKMNSRVFVT
jgi:signal transduction histidine kinase/CheY-like chemotaxis protein/HPt (histidine-containing phosphotransfer) domain-containing protein